MGGGGGGGRGVSRKAPSVVDRKADKVEEKVN